MKSVVSSLGCTMPHPHHAVTSTRTRRFPPGLSSSKAWIDLHKYKINTATIPDYLTGAITAISNGPINLAHEYNLCGRPDNINPQHACEGDTIRRANVDSRLRCITPDNVNVIDFAHTSVYAKACMWGVNDGEVTPPTLGSMTAWRRTMHISGGQRVGAPIVVFT